MTRSVSLRFWAVDQPYMFMYSGMMSQPHLGKLEWWRQALDDLDAMIWRPYLECEPWEDDTEALPYVFMT